MSTNDAQGIDGSIMARELKIVVMFFPPGVPLRDRRLVRLQAEQRIVAKELAGCLPQRDGCLFPQERS